MVGGEEMGGFIFGEVPTEQKGRSYNQQRSNYGVSQSGVAIKQQIFCKVFMNNYVVMLVILILLFLHSYYDKIIIVRN